MVEGHYIMNLEALKPYIERLDKNTQRARETARRLGIRETHEHYRIHADLVGDIIYQIINNNNEFYVPKQPNFIRNGKMWSCLSYKFEKIEEVIDFFREIKDSFIGLYQVFVNRTVSFDWGEPKISIMVRMSTDYWENRKHEHTQSFLNNIKPEFLTKEEMTI